MLGGHHGKKATSAGSVALSGCLTSWICLIGSRNTQPCSRRGWSLICRWRNEFMKLIKPNTILPRGGKLLKPFKKQIGGWVAMEFDAEVQVSGVRWLRVMGGMGDKPDNDREDWVADVPLTASVHDYQWREPFWGSVRYATFEQGCRDQFKYALERLQAESTELESKLASIRKTVRQFATNTAPSHPIPAMRPRRAIVGARRG